MQTTDVHEPNHPLPEHAERFVTSAQREQLDAWNERLWRAGADLWGGTSIAHFHAEAIRLAEIDRHASCDARRGLYDETMLQQDAELRAFVQELKDEGERERTLLIIGSDHGTRPALSRAGGAACSSHPCPSGRVRSSTATARACR